MPLGLHIYIPLFSLQPPLPFSFLNFVPHKRLTKKKLSRRRQPLTATRHRQTHQCSLFLSLPHAAFTPPLAPRSLTPPPVPPTLSLTLPLTLPSRRHLPSITDLTLICYMPALLQYQMSKKKYHKICLKLIHVCELFFFFSYFNIEEIYVNVCVLFWCLILGYLFIFLVEIGRAHV